MISAGTLPRRGFFKVSSKNTSIYSYTTTSYLVQKIDSLKEIQVLFLKNDAICSI
jgi:hypothetical protein